MPAAGYFRRYRKTSKIVKSALWRVHHSGAIVQPGASVEVVFSGPCPFLAISLPSAVSIIPVVPNLPRTEKSCVWPIRSTNSGVLLRSATGRGLIRTLRDFSYLLEDVGLFRGNAKVFQLLRRFRIKFLSGICFLRSYLPVLLPLINQPT